MNRLETGNEQADRLLTLLIARAAQYQEPYRDDVCDGVNWPFYPYAWLIQHADLNLIQIIDALSYLQAEEYVETDLQPATVGPRQLALKLLSGVHIRMRALIEAAA